MNLTVCHCLCFICFALFVHCKEHDNVTDDKHYDEEDHWPDQDDHDHHEGHDHSSHKHDTHAERDHHPSHVHREDKNMVGDYRIWLAATGSILAISLCGIFGVIVIPIMQRVFYQHLIQFLIALAVGTLTGDALLHLLPHAFIALFSKGSGHHDDHHDHDSAVWLGFTATIAMLSFFFFEKLVNVLGEWKQERAKGTQSERHQEQDRKLRVVREGHVASDKAIGERVCKNKYSSYCVTDFELNREDDKQCNKRGTRPSSSSVKPDLLDPSQASTLLPTTSSSPTNVAYTVGLGSSMDMSSPTGPDHDTVIISEHEVPHHGHSHAHSHLHSAPGNISSVAWMVIFGDGIHNLADGLAIGAAFADGFMSGFSTSVAVLCHELPHEIGDFAMLLKAGMTIKQAIFYNVLSSLLAGLGMIGGLALGTIGHFSSWMFAATAGIFLYIALVDMIPELSSGHTHPISRMEQKQAQCLSFMLQIIGMASGVLIMLLIALFEHNLKTALGEELAKEESSIHHDH